MVSVPLYLAWNRKCIIPIVEGYGDVTAVPRLLWQWFNDQGLHDYWAPDRAIFTGGCGRLKCGHNEQAHKGIEYYVRIATMRPVHGILVITDADKDCIRRERKNEEPLGPELLRRAQSVVGHIPIAVVIANREYEAWFLSQWKNLQAEGVAVPGFSLAEDLDIESLAGCKGQMRELLGEPYEETVHQELLSRHLVFTEHAQERSPSFHKLVQRLSALTAV